MDTDNVVPMGRRGRPLSRDGQIDQAALHLIDANCALVALAAADDEYASERRRILKRVADSHRALDTYLRSLRAKAA